MKMGRFNVALLRFLFVIIWVNRLWEQAVNITISSMEIKWSQKQFLIRKRKDEEELEAPDCTLCATWYATGLDGIFIWCNNSVKASAPNILPVNFSFKYKLFNQGGTFLSRLAAIQVHLSAFMDCNCRPMISGSRSLYSALHLILTLDNPLTAQFNSCQSLSPVSTWANTLSTQLSSYPHIAWRSCHQHPLPCQQLSSCPIISCHKIVHLVASNPCLYSADDLAGAATILTGHNPAGLCSGSREGTQIKARRGIGAQLNTNRAATSIYGPAGSRKKWGHR